MSSQVPNSPASIMKANDIPNIKRSIANFHPSIWNDHFLSFSFDDALVKSNCLSRLLYFN